MTHTNPDSEIEKLKSELVDALDNHKRTLEYIVIDHAPRNATNYEVYMKKLIRVDTKLNALTNPDTKEES